MYWTCFVHKVLPIRDVFTGRSTDCLIYLPFVTVICMAYCDVGDN